MNEVLEIKSKLQKIPGFEQSLKETQIWCDRKLASTPTESWIDYEGQVPNLVVLRSPELAPTKAIKNGKEIDSTYYDFSHLAAWVYYRRHENLPYKENYKHQALGVIDASRLLIYEPSLCLQEGACKTASGGYFDNVDSPPWDTWVSYVKDDIFKLGISPFIISYIPEGFDDQIDDGIDAGSTGCIYRLNNLPEMRSWLQSKPWHRRLRDLIIDMLK